MNKLLSENITEKYDVIIVGFYKENYEYLNSKYSEQFNVEFSEIIKKKIPKETVGKALIVHNFELSNYDSINLICLGSKEEFKLSNLGKVFAGVNTSLGSKVLVDLDSFKNDNIEFSKLVLKISETITLKNYKFNELKSKQENDVFDIDYYSIEKVGKSIDTGFIYGNSTNNSRTLVNRPYSHLSANDLGNYALELGKKLGIETTVVGKAEIEKLKMGAFLAVNKGSTEEPKLIVMKYQGKDKWENPIALVGKGLVFDSGGYSLKTNMVNMKTDMGGAAAVLGAMEIIGNIKPKENVLLVIAATDNRINGHALLPDDVVTASNGKTIEIISTDAEGRLTLADAVQHAQNLGAKKVIDVATLTGGVVVALGNSITGYWTNSDIMRERLVKSALNNNELIWEMPIMDHVRDGVRASKIADLLNSVGRPGTSLGAAAFIEEFINEGTEWIHLDIAGTASISSPNDFGPYGGTGVMARTLADFVINE